MYAKYILTGNASPLYRDEVKTDLLLANMKHVSCDFHDHSSESVNPVLLGTPWNFNCDLIKFVCGTKTSKTKKHDVSHIYKVMVVIAM